MRVLQISSAEHFGGGERHLCDLVQGLRGAGISVDAVVRPSCGWKERLADATGTEPREAPLSGSADLLSAFRIARIARDGRYDIIHAHLARDYIPVSVAARMSGARFVLTRHVLFPISSVTRALIGNVSQAIAVSGGVEAELRKSFDHSTVSRVPNGIRVPANSPRETKALAEEFRDMHSVPDGKRIIATVGELSPVKGQDDLILAFAEVVRNVPEAFQVIVGKDNGPRGAFKRKLRRLAKVSGISESVLFLDWVDDTAPLLAAAEVLVSPSRSESFGLAMLEAMARGVPVAATRTAGAEELILHGKTGLISDVGDPVGLAGNVASILTDSDLAEELASNARNRAAKSFSIEKMVESTIQTYQKALGEE